MNSYGPSECTDVVAFYEVEATRTDERQPIPIGHAVPGVLLEVLSESLLPVATGAPGHLFVSGVAVGEGYVGETAEPGSQGFVDGPSGSRLYDTGDIVYARWDGELVFAGRADDQVKLRGHRINLGDVEAAIRRCPSVVDAAVTIHSLREQGPALCGYYLAVDEIDPSLLRRELRSVLPAYMVPSFFVRLDKMPVTVSGKLDRLSLAPPQIKREVDVAELLTELERKVGRVWAEVLGFDTIDIDDDFFEIGGHSLLAVKLAEAIELAFACECTVVNVAANPTVRMLGRFLERSLTDGLVA